MHTGTQPAGNGPVSQPAMLAKRRVTHSPRYGRVIFVRPPGRLTPEAFEVRALLAGYIAVIGGRVIEPGTAEATAYSERYGRFGD